MADQQILVTGTSPTPLSYTVPNAIEAALLCVNATVDGTAAPSAFYATVEIVSDGGVVVARCPCFTTIAAGGSAEVSWFRMRETQTAITPVATPYAELIFGVGGLQLYYKLDDAAGSTTIKDSFGGNDGTVYDTVSLGQPPLADVTAGLFGAGMAGRKTTALYDQSTQLMSVVVWVETTAVAALNTVAWADTSSAGGRLFQMTMTAAGHISVSVFNNGGVGVNFGGAVAVNNGLKHMLAFTYGATNPVTGAGAVGSIYVDGALDTSTPLAMGGVGLSKNNQGVLLGAEWRNALDGNSGFNKLAGTLDEFALFNSTLTASQMAAINVAGRI